MASAAHLGWVAEPEKLKGLSADRPDPAENPVIVGRYDKKPRGGLRDNPRGPWLFCCHCQSHRHWEGYILAGGDGRLYTIGSKCGPEHYGAERFRRARKSYREIEDRALLIRRARYIVDRHAKLGDEIDALFNCDGLKSIEFTAGALLRASPDMVARLRPSVISGESLRTTIMARGTSGRMEPVPRSIGMLEGVAVIDCTVRQRAAELLDALAKLSDGAANQWAAEGVSTLQLSVRTAERGAVDFLAALRVARKAADFFSPRNRARLVRWAVPLNRFLRVESDEDGDLLIIDNRVIAGAERVAAIGSVHLPRQYACEQISKATAGI